MKTTLARIAVLTIVILAILLSVRPQQDTAAVTQFTVGVPSETAHNKPIVWADAKESLYIPAHTAGYRLGDCYADRTANDLYPQPDPFCLPVPSVQPAKVKSENETHETVITETEQPKQPIDDGGETIPTPEQPEKDKKHCNKGSGNGSEGCDPGNRPENGNNDEGGDRRPENSNGNRPEQSVVIGMLVTFVMGRSKRQYNIDGVRSIKRQVGGKGLILFMVDSYDGDKVYLVDNAEIVSCFASQEPFGWMNEEVKSKLR